MQQKEVQVVEEVLKGYRRYYSQFHLGTLMGGAGTVWEGRELRAGCAGNEELARKHLLTDQCTCGIYTSKSKDAANNWGDVVAEVLIWGAVCEGTLGYRSEYAQIDALFLEDTVPVAVAAALEKRYGVPVTYISKLDKTVVE